MKVSVEYKDIPGFQGYLAGSDGSIWSCRVAANRRELKQCRNKNGRLSVMLCPSMRRINTYRLVLLAFVGPCPAGMEACHNDGDNANNSVSNLRWDTKSNNEADKLLHGTLIRGVRCHLSKLTDATIQRIRLDYDMEGVSHSSLATRYGVTRATISRIVRRKIWSHIA